MQYRIIIITGVSGSGKTTVGKELAQLTNLPFFDADDFHPPANIRKMVSKQALTDADRWPWLEAMARFLAQHLAEQGSLILACSCLKDAYRNALTAHLNEGDVTWVHLVGTYEEVWERVKQREDHFMPPELLASQFADYESPQTGFKVPLVWPVSKTLQTLSQILSWKKHSSD